MKKPKPYRSEAKYHNGAERSSGKHARGSKGATPMGTIYRSGKLTADSFITYRGIKNTRIRDLLTTDIQWLIWMDNKFVARFHPDLKARLKASVAPTLNDTAD